MDDSGPTAGIICFLLLLLVDMFFYGFFEATNHLTARKWKDVPKKTKIKSLSGCGKLSVYRLSLKM